MIKTQFGREVDMKNSERIVYSINVEDIQEVAREVLERKLTKREILLIEDSIGDYINWFDAIEFAIKKHIEIRPEHDG
jgi:nucleoside-triphosphatase THEP1